jgi:HJR/Mrr/RecB family endonuclease
MIAKTNDIMDVKWQIESIVYIKRTSFLSTGIYKSVKVVLSMALLYNYHIEFPWSWAHSIGTIKKGQKANGLSKRANLLKM